MKLKSRTFISIVIFIIVVLVATLIAIDHPYAWKWTHTELRNATMDDLLTLGIFLVVINSLFNNSSKD